MELSTGFKKKLNDIYCRPLTELTRVAWEIRSAEAPPVLNVAAPGIKRFDIGVYQNNPVTFTSISITGNKCSLKCEHCGGLLLKNMRKALTATSLVELGGKLKDQGCRGVLITGGCDQRGCVPLEPFLNSLARLKEMGLTVIVHSGLVSRQTALDLESAGVDQVLIDIIGSSETVAKVYHLRREPEDYGRSLDNILNAGLKVFPHIIIGLHFGKIIGELEALYQVLSREINNVIFVILTPLPGTGMADVNPPSATTVGRFIATARIAGPSANIVLGCARPGGAAGEQIEQYALEAGINGIAFPSRKAIARANKLGLKLSYHDLCCSLA